MSHKESHHGINALIQQSSSRATKNMDASLSHCPQCSCHLDKEGVSEHSFDCRLSSRVPSVQPQALFSHRHQEKRNPSHACLRLSFDYSNVQQIHCKRLQPYQRHLNLNSMQLLGRIVFMLTVFLSFCDVSFAHVTLPWDSWSIEDTTASETSLDHHILDSMMKVPDLVAVAGHLFKYQIPTAPSEDTRTVYYQTREAGRNKLPKWLSFNQTLATFRGVPLIQDKGKLYITLNVYDTERGGSVVVAESLFSIHVVVSMLAKQVAAVAYKHEQKDEDISDQCNCQPNFHLSIEDVPIYSHCSDAQLPVLASMITFLNLRSLAGSARADLFVTISKMIGICPHLLVVDSVDWSSREGMKLWMQLAESGIIEYLNFATILSFQLSCGDIDYKNKSMVSLLSHLDQYLANQSENMTISNNGKDTSLVFLYLRWFISRDSQVLLTSAPAPEEVHSRLRRQATDVIEEEPIINIVLTTTIPDIVSSSVVTSSTSTSSSSSLQLTSSIDDSTGLAAINSSPTEGVSVSSRVFVASSNFAVVGSSVPVHDSSSMVYPDPTSTQFSGRATSSDDHIITVVLTYGVLLDNTIESSMIVPTAAGLLPLSQPTGNPIASLFVSGESSSISEFSSRVAIASSSIMIQDSSSVESPDPTPSMTSGITPSSVRTDDRTTAAGHTSLESTIESIPTVRGPQPSSQQTIPSSRVIPGVMTRVDSSLEVSADSSIETFSTAGVRVTLSQLIIPSNRVIPSSEPTPVLEPLSLSVTVAPSASLPVSQTTSSPDLELSETSIPVMSAMFSVQSLVTSLLILTESVFPTSSTIPSRSFTVRSSIEDLPSSTVSLSTFSLSLSLTPSSLLVSISSFMPDSTSSVLMPNVFTSVRISPSASFRPTSSLVSPLPTMSSFIPDASSVILLPETSTLILPTPSMSFRLTTSDIAPEPTPSILIPDGSSGLLMPDISTSTSLSFSSQLTSIPQISPSISGGSSGILLPETTSSIFVESTPTLSLSTELPPPPTSMLLMPDPTVTPSSVVQTSSDDMLMPMSSSELTMSLSNFTSSPTPSVFHITFSVDVSPMSTFTPTFTDTVLTTRPTATDTFAVTSSMAIPSSSFTSTFMVSGVASLPVPSSSEFIFLETSTLLLHSTMFAISSSFIMSTPTMVNSSPLTPMPSFDTTALLSALAPSPSPSVLRTPLLTTETVTPSPSPSVLRTPLLTTETVTPSPSPSVLRTPLLTTETVTPSPSPSVLRTPLLTTETVTPSPSPSVLRTPLLTTETVTPSPSPSVLRTPLLTTETVTPSPSPSVLRTPLLTTETVILPTQETMIFLPKSTTVLPTMTITIDLPTPTSTQIVSTPVFTPTPLSSHQLVESVSTIRDMFPTTQVILTTRFPSPSIAPSSSSMAPSSSSMVPSLPPSLSPSPSPTFCDIICRNGTCLLNDSAIDPVEFIVCDCYPDYTGEYCNEVIDNCNPSPCFVNGTSECADGNVTFTCVCNAGYTGHICDEEIDGCLSSPCQSPGATCVSLRLGAFECQCPPGYSGMFCEVDVDPCDPNPCLFNETCMITDSRNFTCDQVVVTSVVFTSSVAVPTTMILAESPSVSMPSPNVTSFIIASTSQPQNLTFSSEIALETSSFSMETSSVYITSSQVFSTISPTSSVSLSSTLTMISFPTPAPSSSLSLTTMVPTSHLTMMPSQSPSLTPTVTNTPVVNLSPLLLNPIGTLIVNIGQIFQFSIPEDTFYDPESGTTSFLSLSLLNFKGEPLPRTTWIQMKESHLEGLPLASEITNEAITDHVFILQAKDEMGNSAHDFVTIRVLPLGPFSSFFTILFENEFGAFNRNLTQKIDLVQRLSSSNISSPLRKRQLQLPAQMYNTEEIFVKEIFDSTALAVSYKNLSISDLNCTEFYEWSGNIYNYSSNEYTPRFVKVMAPEFLPTPTPRIEGTCSLVSSNIPPTLAEVEIDISDSTISDRAILLSTIVPGVCVALCCFLIGLCALCMYRRNRSERKYLTSKRLYLNRRPIILEGEVDLPNRRRRPVIFANEIALRGENANILLQEEEEDQYSDTSSEGIMPPAGDRDRLLWDPSIPPPNYRLPPLYTRGEFQDILHDR